MSRGNELQEMEVKTQQSKTAANANAKPGDPMPSLSGTTPGQSGSYEDLGGPTPENYKTDDDSAKLKTPGKTLKQVRDVVNAKAKLQSCTCWHEGRRSSSRGTRDRRRRNNH